MLYLGEGKKHHKWMDGRAWEKMVTHLQTESCLGYQIKEIHDKIIKRRMTFFHKLSPSS